MKVLSGPAETASLNSELKNVLAKRRRVAREEHWKWRFWAPNWGEQEAVFGHPRRMPLE